MSKIRFLSYFIAFIAVVALQTTVVHAISIRGIKPDLVMIFLVFLSMKEGALVGVYAGFFPGLFLDVYAPQYLGIGSFAKSVVGYLAGLLDERNIKIDDRYKLIVLFLASVVHDAITSVGVYGSGPTFGRLLLSNILPAAIYSTMCGGIILLLLIRRGYYGDAKHSG